LENLNNIEIKKQRIEVRRSDKRRKVIQLYKYTIIQVGKKEKVKCWNLIHSEFAEESNSLIKM